MIRDLENKFFREFQYDGAAIMSIAISEMERQEEKIIPMAFLQRFGNARKLSIHGRGAVYGIAVL